MRETSEAALRIASQWAEKAENDLLTATHILRLGADCPTDIVCFHAQQCVEKYLKALLVLHKVDFPRTHHISVLLELLPADTRPDLEPNAQERLTDYVVTTRYPGDYEPIPLREAKQAVVLARRVRNHVRKLLP